MANTLATACSNVGTELRRFVLGSPPARATLRLATAASRASASVTRRSGPSPSFRRLPWMNSRWIHMLVAGRLDAQHEAVLVPVQARVPDAPHEGGGEFSAVFAHSVTLSWSPRRSPFPYWNTVNALTRQYNINNATATTSLALLDFLEPSWTARYTLPWRSRMRHLAILARRRSLVSS